MVTMSIMLSPSGSSRLTPNHPSTAPPAARRSCWVDSRRRWPSPGRDRGRRAPPGARRPCRQVTRSVLFKWTRSHRADPGQGPRSRLVGTAPPFRRTEARAQRTLERLSPEQPQPGSVGQLLRPALPSPRRQERDDKGRALGVQIWGFQGESFPLAAQRAELFSADGTAQSRVALTHESTALASRSSPTQILSGRTRSMIRIRLGSSFSNSSDCFMAYTSLVEARVRFSKEARPPGRAVSSSA